MPTKWVSGAPDRRLIISCPAELRAALEDLAEARGVPVAKVATETLVEFIPTLHDLAKWMRYTKAGNKGGASRVLRQMFGNALAEHLTSAKAEQLELVPKGRGK